MATVWMRAKLQKLKPKVEPKLGKRTLAEHGPGNYPDVRFRDHKGITATVAADQYVRKVKPIALGKRVQPEGKGNRRRELRTYGNYNWSPVSVLQADIYAPAGVSTLIRNGRVVTC